MHSLDRTVNITIVRLYWAYALIRHYLTTVRKYALIKKYALNKHVRLLMVFTPHACARGKVIGSVVVIVISAKITKSQKTGIRQSCQIAYNCP